MHHHGCPASWRGGGQGIWGPSLRPHSGFHPCQRDDSPVPLLVVLRLLVEPQLHPEPYRHRLLGSSLCRPGERIQRGEGGFSLCTLSPAWGPGTQQEPGCPGSPHVQTGRRL